MTLAGAAGADPAPPAPAFTPVTSGVAALYPTAVDAGDFNGDGDPDLASTTVSNSSTHVYVHTGAGDGTFQSQSTQTTFGGGGTSDAAAGDLDGDTYDDLVVANSGSSQGQGSITVLHGSAAGLTGGPGDELALAGSFPSDVAIGDFDEDGKADVVVAVGGAATNGIELVRFTDTGYDEDYVVSPDQGQPQALAVADLDGDGHLDIATATTYPDFAATILLGEGDGTFTTVPGPTFADYPEDIATGDVDGDGDVDVVVQTGVAVTVVRRDPSDESWSGIRLPLTTGAGPTGLTTADLDGDGTDEIVESEGSAGTPANRHLEIFRWDGTTWPQWTLVSPPAGVDMGPIVAADIDTDGDTDLAVADNSYNGGADALTSYLNGGTAVGSDTTAPVTTDDVPASAVHAPVTVTLSATDAGGSGVKEIRYTTGATPAEPTASSALYDDASKPTLLNGEKIRYFAVDNAGNAEAPHSSAAAQVTATVSTPTIGGSPVVGQTLTASATVQPAGATPTYQWQRIDSGGTRAPIAGATGSTYQVQAADVGQRLGVQVSVAPSGYAPASADSSPTAVVTAAPTTTPPTTTPSTPITGLTVRAVGGVRVGETRVAETSVDGDPSVTLSYQWQAAGLNGSWVNLTGAGATSRSYELPPGVMKINVRVVVLATRGSAQALVISAPLVILPGNHDAKKLRIKGNLVVGGKLRAVFKDKVVPAGAKVTYSWVIGGNEYRLSGKRITVPKGAAGKKVIVDIRITAPGYHNQELRSPVVRIA